MIDIIDTNLKGKLYEDSMTEVININLEGKLPKQKNMKLLAKKILKIQGVDDSKGKVMSAVSNLGVIVVNGNYNPSEVYQIVTSSGYPIKNTFFLKKMRRFK